MCDTEDVSGAFLEQQDEDAWKRLAEFVKSRRAELGLTQAEARQAGGVGNVFWSDLENGKGGTRMQMLSARGVEKAMKWKKDSVSWIVLHRGEPTSIEDAPDVDFLAEEIASLSADVRKLTEVVASQQAVIDILAPLAKALKNYR